jgi:hypothetical protein
MRLKAKKMIEMDEEPTCTLVCPCGHSQSLEPTIIKPGKEEKFYCKSCKKLIMTAQFLKAKGAKCE